MADIRTSTAEVIPEAPPAPTHVAIRREDYRPPDWLVPEIALDFDLDADRTRVRATLHGRAQRRSRPPAPARRRRDDAALSVKVDGADADWRMDGADAGHRHRRRPRDGRDRGRDSARPPTPS